MEFSLTDRILYIRKTESNRYSVGTCVYIISQRPRISGTPTHRCPTVYTGASFNHFVYTAGISGSRVNMPDISIPIPPTIALNIPIGDVCSAFSLKTSCKKNLNSFCLRFKSRSTFDQFLSAKTRTPAIEQTAQSIGGRNAIILHYSTHPFRCSTHLTRCFFEFRSSPQNIKKIFLMSRLLLILSSFAKTFTIDNVQRVALNCHCFLPKFWSRLVGCELISWRLA